MLLFECSTSLLCIVQTDEQISQRGNTKMNGISVLVRKALVQHIIIKVLSNWDNTVETNQDQNICYQI